MPIKSAHLQNVTVFEDMQIHFSDGINVVIGTNGTGKTHLLKYLYGVCESVKSDTITAFETMIPYFLVDSNSLKRDLLAESMIEVEFTNNHSAVYVINKGEEFHIKCAGNKTLNSGFIVKSIFIPAKEMLSHSKGFLALYNKYKIPFDKTYIDIIVNAELPEARETSKLNEALLHTISTVIGGEVLYENGAFYIVKIDGQKIEFPVEAEGLRKFGLLWKLIKNGLLEKGVVLFWDEPEANINPELMPVLVELMLELQRKGVQIFIATHSYNLAKYLEIKREKENQVLFHHLHQTVNGVKVSSDIYFGQLDDNPIIEADARLLDEVIEGNFDD